MKFTALFVAVSCVLCVCFAEAPRPRGPPILSTWGNVNGRVLGTESVVVESSFMQVKTHTFTYPKSSSSAWPIFGFKHWDYKSHPVEVRIMKGDIGHKNITIKISSQRNHGINSTFVFYTN